MPETKIGKIKIIRDYFDPVTMAEMKSLTPEDRTDLASGIAFHLGLTAEQLDFVPNDYR